MKAFAFAPAFLCLLAAASAAHGQNPDLRAGGEQGFRVEGMGVDLKLYTPEDFDPADAGRKWPAIFWYHGTGGSPETGLMRKFTGGRGFFIVGMTYASRGLLQYEQEPGKNQFSEEIALFQKVRDQVKELAPIDPKRAYVGGYSKGGWTSALMMEEIGDELAGALPMGGGLLEGAHSRTPKRLDGKPIYLGAGDAETNVIYTRNAARVFRDLGARVTLEEYRGLGHRPPDDSEILRQWLKVEAHSDRLIELKDEAEKWFADSIAAAKAEEDKMAQYLRLVAMGESPFLRLAGKENRDGLAAALNKVRTRSPIREEYRAELEVKRIADRETQQRTLPHEIQRYYEYIQVTREYPDSFWAKRAAQEAARVLASIRRREDYLRKLGKPFKPFDPEG